VSLDPVHLLTILGMAAVTLACRLGGYLLARHITFRGRAAAAMEAMPVAVLMSLIVPTALATGPAETVAAAITTLAAWRLPLIAAVAIGTLAVVLLRLAV
jgi:uncharacterized membrane protein